MFKNTLSLKFKFQLLIDQPERFPVMSCNANVPDRFSMRIRWIALVPVPGVARKFRVETFHKIIAVSFGQYRSRRDGEKLGISLNYAGMRDPLIGFEPIAVNEDMPGNDRKF